MKRVSLAVIFSLACLATYTHIDQHPAFESRAASVATSQCPIPWAVIQQYTENSPKTFLSYQGLWASIDRSDAALTKVRISQMQGERKQNDLYVDYLEYFLDEQGNTITCRPVQEKLENFFKEKGDKRYLQIPPQLGVYTDLEAKEKGLPQIPEGKVGLQSTYAVPWEAGAVGVFTNKKSLGE